MRRENESESDILLRGGDESELGGVHSGRLGCGRRSKVRRWDGRMLTLVFGLKREA